MNFVKMMEAHGINLENLSDYELALLSYAIPQEKERRARVKREQLIAEYTDKINNLINELQEEGLTLSYNGESFGIDDLEIG